MASALSQMSGRAWGLSDMSGRLESSLRPQFLRTMAQGPDAQSTKYGDEGGLCCNSSLIRFIKYLIGSHSQGTHRWFFWDFGLVDRIEVAVGRMGGLRHAKGWSGLEETGSATPCPDNLVPGVPSISFLDHI